MGVLDNLRCILKSGLTTWSTLPFACFVGLAQLRVAMRICNSFESLVYSILDSTNLAFAQYIVDQTQTSTCKHVDCFLFPC